MKAKDNRKQLYRKENLKKSTRPQKAGVSLWDFLRGIERTDHHWRANVCQNPKLA